MLDPNDAARDANLEADAQASAARELRRSRIWHDIWNRRNEAIVDRNGFEACLPELAAYHSFVRTVADLVVDKLAITPRDHLADFGCGTGMVAAQVAARAGSILGIDYSEHALEVARTHRGLPNIRYHRADLLELDPDALDPAITKAYSMGVFLYLDDYPSVRRLLKDLLARGIELLVLDLPDKRKQRLVARPYDIQRYSHLYFDEDELRADFPGVTVLHAPLPENPNNDMRFGIHLRP